MIEANRTKLTEYGDPVFAVLDFDSFPETVWGPYREPVVLDNRYNGITIEECHFFKNRRVNRAKDGLKKPGLTVNYSIELATPNTLVIEYENMPDKYKVLWAKNLLRWGLENGLADLPDLADLDKSLLDLKCVNAKVYYLVQAYMLQFNWIRLQKDLNGSYVEINEDNL